MFTFLPHAGAALLLPALLTSPPGPPCPLDGPTYVSADERAIARFTAAANDYVAFGKQGAIFNDDAAAIFRFRLRISRWLHRYHATQTIADLARAAGTTSHARLTAPGVAEAALPELPDELGYRIAGSHLLLLDGRTHAVVDLIPDAFSEGW
jgi:hypothetical protein